MLDPLELAAAQQDATALLTGIATVLNPVLLPDGGGGQVESYEPGPVVAARIAPAGRIDVEGVKGGRVDERTTHIVTVPAGTPVAGSDRILMDGTTFEVTAVRTRSDELLRRVEVKEAP